MQNMVVVRDIDIFSYCEHHLALMYDMKVTVAYVPNGTGSLVSVKLQESRIWWQSGYSFRNESAQILRILCTHGYRSRRYCGIY